MDEAKDAARLAARYPSIPSLRDGAEKPAAARAEAPPAKAPALARAEEVRLKANVRAPEPTNDAEVAAARLAKRYPSLKTTAEDPNPESAGVTIDPALRARYPSIGEAGEKSPAELALEAPEGFDAADPHFVEFKKAAGEIGLDQGKASRMLELHRKVLAAQEQARDEEAKGWRAEVEQDAEVMDNVETTRWLVREYGGKEFTEALGPLGDHPAIVRALTRIAKDLDAARRRGTYR